jgi:hypothetical protein
VKRRLPAVVARHRPAVIVGAVVVAIAVVTIVVIRAGTGGSSGPSATPTTKPSGPTAELVALVRRSQAVNVDVAYTGTEATTGAFGAHLWQRSPLARLDTESGQGDTLKRSTQLLGSSGPQACTKSGTAPWSCVSKPGLTLGDVGVVSPALVAKLSSLDVSVHDDRILDQAVRCFTVARPAGATTTTGPTGAGADLNAAELCLTSDGIPVRVVAGSTRLDAVSLNRGRAPDSIFQTPSG